MRGLGGVYGVVVAVATAGAGCASAQPYQAEIAVQTLTAAPPQEAEGVTIDAAAVTPHNVRERGELQVELSWREADARSATDHSGGGMGNMGGMGAGGSRPMTVQRSAVVTLAPLPVVWLHIKNASGHALRFDHAALALDDGAGHRFAPLTDVGALQGRVSNDARGADARLADAPGVLDAVHDRVAQLRWLSTATVVAAGSEWDGYLAFAHEVHGADDFNAFMTGAALTATLGGLTLDGTALAPIAFSFTRRTVTAKVTCPGEVKKPTLAGCKAASP